MTIDNSPHLWLTTEERCKSIAMMSGLAAHLDRFIQASGVVDNADMLLFPADVREAIYLLATAIMRELDGLYADDPDPLVRGAAGRAIGEDGY